MGLCSALQVVVDQVCGQLNADAASILVLDPETQVLQYVAGKGFQTPGVVQTRVAVGEGRAGRIALEKQLLVVPDLRDESIDLISGRMLMEEGFVEYCGAPLLARGELRGVLEVFNRNPSGQGGDCIAFLEVLAGQAAIAIDNLTLFDGLQRTSAELVASYDSTLEGWARALDLRDNETEGHTRRVTEVTLHLGRAMGLNDEELTHIRRGALLHDIGKIGIPDAILLKPGKLDDEERAVMQRHPTYAYQWLAPISFLQPALDIPHYHHEKWDGTGYPCGLRG